MYARTIAAILALGLIALPNIGAAQSSDVTFTVPLNLTQVSTDITKVAVWCKISSSAFPGSGAQRIPTEPQQQVEVPISGRLVTTVSVTVPVSGLVDPAGKSAQYTCKLSGFSSSLQRWDVFSTAATTPAFRLTPTPPDLSGNFVWL